MGSSINPNAYIELGRQIAEINALPFSRELKQRMIQRANAKFYRDNGLEPEEFGVEDYPWRRDVPPEREIRA